MTCLIVLDIVELFSHSINSLKIKVSKYASEINGTTAELEYGDVITVEDLLYGLMLPSGNDAAIVLSQSLGALLVLKKKKMDKLIQLIQKMQVIDVEKLS